MHDPNFAAGPLDARAAAISRLSAIRGFMAHAVTYIVVNTAVVVIWFVTGHGDFWPGWALGGWGILLVLHAWAVYGRTSISEEQIRREMNRQAGHRA